MLPSHHLVEHACRILVLDEEALRPVCEIRECTHAIHDLKYNPQATVLAAACADRHVDLYAVGPTRYSRFARCAGVPTSCVLLPFTRQRMALIAQQTMSFGSASLVSQSHRAQPHWRLCPSLCACSTASHSQHYYVLKCLYTPVHFRTRHFSRSAQHACSSLEPRTA